MKQSTRKLLPTLVGCLIAAPAASWALGLGEITLQSYLGQPLEASIPVLAGPGETIEENCFQVRPDNSAGLPGVVGINIVLQRQTDGARLLLRSRQSVNEPAVAISVVTDCPQRLSRQYLVLLDPPLIVVPPVISGAAADAASPPKSAAHLAHADKPAGDRAAIRPNTPAASAHRHRATHAHAASMSGPRLVLSGRKLARAGTPSFGLRMDASLPTPGKYQDTPLTPTETQDENASLNHKLAYLEQQLTSLQRRNTELEQAALRARASQPPAKPAAANTNVWQASLAGLALLSTGGLLAWRWRRQRQLVKLSPETDVWAPSAEDTRPTWQMEPLAENSDAQTAHNISLTAAEPIKLPVPPPPARTPIMDKWVDKKRAAENGVEVDDSVVDEVEVFMAHGHAELAINLLEEHLRIAPDESPIPWMLLLDLLKRQKLPKEYEEARKACKLHFNIRIPNLDEDEPGPGAAGLEAYPHILAELTRLWDTPECQTYLDDLIFDRRGGSRAGFDPPTYREIMLLRTLQGDETPPVAARYQAY